MKRLIAIIITLIFMFEGAGYCLRPQLISEQKDNRIERLEYAASYSGENGFNVLIYMIKHEKFEKVLVLGLKRDWLMVSGRLESELGRDRIIFEERYVPVVYRYDYEKADMIIVLTKELEYPVRILAGKNVNVFIILKGFGLQLPQGIRGDL